MWMVSDPDGETLICRRFDRLRARNLLYYEAELTELEAEVAAMDAEHGHSADVRVQGAASAWEIFADTSHGPDASERLCKVRRLRKLLREYGRWCNTGGEGARLT